VHEEASTTVFGPAGESYGAASARRRAAALRTLRSAGLACVFMLLPAVAHAQSLKPIGRIPLPGVEGRIDHMAVNPVDQILYVAALGNHTIEVVDLKARRVVREIHGVGEVQGVAYDGADRRLFAASDTDGRFYIFDARNFARLGTVDFTDDADNVRYDSVAGQVVAGYGEGALGFISAPSAKVLFTVPLDGHPESFQLLQTESRVLVNVPTAGEIEVVDRGNRKVIARWRPSAHENFPMALDEPGHRAFIGCRRPAEVLVYDIAAGREVQHLPCVGDTDDLFYDRDAHVLVVSGGAGAVTLLRSGADGKLARVATIPTAPGARTSLYVQPWRRLLVAVPHRGAQRAEIRMFQLEP
jgi:DNA-binding beta-propeller fold protein YncE